MLRPSDIDRFDHQHAKGMAHVLITKALARSDLSREANSSNEA